MQLEAQPAEQPQVQAVKQFSLAHSAPCPTPAWSIAILHACICQSQVCFPIAHTCFWSTPYKSNTPTLNSRLNQHAFEQPDGMEQDDQLATDVATFFTATGA